MSRNDFEQLAWLVFEHEAARATGYSAEHLRKLVDNGLLEVVRPKGTRERKLRKIQLAKLVGLNLSLQARQELAAEPFLLTAKGVKRWTGYDVKTLEKIGAARGLVPLKLAGDGRVWWRKIEVAELAGLGMYV